MEEVHICDARTNKHAKYNKFDFLGFTFRRRRAINSRTNQVFTGFLPAVSDQKKNAIKQRIKAFNWQALLPKGLDNIARVINPYIRGIINYYSKFYPSELEDIWHVLDGRLVKWIMRKRKRYKGKKTKTYKLIEELKSSPRFGRLFAHWHLM